MKIAIDIRNIGKKRTGDEVVFFNLVKQFSVLDKTNDYVLLTDRDPEKDAGLAQEIARLELGANFKVAHLAEEGANKMFWNAVSLPLYLRKEPADILLVQYITPFFIPRKTQIITIIHDVSFKVFPKLVGKVDLFFMNILIPMSLKRADKIIGVSKFTANEILKYYKVDEKKVDWIHNAVSDIFFKEHSQEELEVVRQKYSLPQKFILYIGTLQPRKNLPALIEAYIKIPNEKRKDLKLVLAGGKGRNFDAKIDEYVTSYGLEKDVILPGFIDEMDKPQIFRLAHVFCFPSLYEGFGIPILEAMTLGVPTLASDIPSHAEITEGATMLFKTDDPADLSEKLNRVATDENLRKDIARKELARAQKFSWQKTAEKMLEICKKMTDATPH